MDTKIVVSMTQVYSAKIVYTKVSGSNKIIYMIVYTISVHKTTMHASVLVGVVLVCGGDSGGGSRFSGEGCSGACG